jgi:hypothetical protein
MVDHAREVAMTRTIGHRSATRVVALALPSVLVLAALLASAQGQPRRDEHRDVRREWRHDDRGRAYYPAPPVVYGAPYYAPPPVVYGPGVGINLPGVSINIP